jgi:asparagine synthase (glutamine-hydrolysing)
VRLRIDKMGFVTPEDHWLRGAWRRSIDELLDSESVRARPYWQAVRLREWFHRYCDGHAAIGPTVWRWVALEGWLRRFCD